MKSYKPNINILDIWRQVQGIIRYKIDILGNAQVRENDVQNNRGEVGEGSKLVQ